MLGKRPGHLGRRIFAGATTLIENTAYMLPIIGMPQKTQRGCLPTTTPTTSNLSDLFRTLLSDQRLMCIFTMPLPYVGPANAVPNAVLYCT